MVDGLHSVYVISNCAQRMALPRGMACDFPRRCQGRKFVIEVGPYPGLQVVMLRGCRKSS